MRLRVTGSAAAEKTGVAGSDLRTVWVAPHADLTYSRPWQLVIGSGGNGDRRAPAISGACLQWLELTLSGDSGQLAAGSLPKTAVSSPLRRECRPEPESPRSHALSGIFRVGAGCGAYAIALTGSAYPANRPWMARPDTHGPICAGRRPDSSLEIDRYADR
jgi:hypothetical protein